MVDANDPFMDLDYMQYLLKYDSVHKGRPQQPDDMVMATVTTTVTKTSTTTMSMATTAAPFDCDSGYFDMYDGCGVFVGD
eukprot:1464716-Alexandrium_andersonii.AAC.1